MSEYRVSTKHRNLLIAKAFISFHNMSPNPLFFSYFFLDLEFCEFDSIICLFIASGFFLKVWPSRFYLLLIRTSILFSFVPIVQRFFIISNKFILKILLWNLFIITYYLLVIVIILRLSTLVWLIFIFLNYNV